MTSTPKVHLYSMHGCETIGEGERKNEIDEKKGEKVVYLPILASCHHLGHDDGTAEQKL